MKSKVLALISSSLLLLVFTIAKLTGQDTFARKYYIDIEEPLAGQQIAEVPGGYLIGGQYFESDIPSWTYHQAIFDHSGNLKDVYVNTVDTVPLLTEKNFVSNSAELFAFSALNGQLNIIVYDIAVDTTYVKYKIDEVQHDIAVWSGITIGDSTLIIAGENFVDSSHGRHVAIASIDSSGMTTPYHFPELSGFFYNSLIYSEDRLVLLRVFDDETTTGRSVSLVFMDYDLNIISHSDTIGYTANLFPGEGMIKDIEGNIWICGYQAEQISNDFIIHPCVAKFSPDGRHFFTKRIKVNVVDDEWWNNINSLVEANNQDGILLVGSELVEKRPGKLDADAVVKKIDYSGNLIWKKTFDFAIGERVVDEFSAISNTTDGGFIICGSSYDFDRESEGPWIQALLVKLDSTGNMVSTLEIDDSLDQEKPLVTYPNPVHETLTIELPADERGSLKLLDIKGQIIWSSTSIIHEESVELDMSNYLSGTYLLEFIPIDYKNRQVRKSLIIKE